ncbi:MAG: TorF family putative porin [Burkholderiales bacterium]|nr:TorF family putative porin [Burkholderiales bacterium]
MHKLAVCTAFVSLAAPGIALAQAAASPHTLTANVSLVSDYRFRGISQTFRQPALQGGFDYAHSSGFYLGNWNSNVSEGAGFPGANLEMDFYGGWKKSWGDWGVDLGAIHYYYPGSDASVAAGTQFVNPRDPAKVHTGRVDNTELYAGVSWKWLSLKYYHAVSDYFSLPGTKGSRYWDLSANYDLGGGWTLVAHLGALKLKGWHDGTDATKGSYTDWKLGVTKDLGGWVLGAAYVDTNAKGSCNPANPGFYCFGDRLPGAAATRFKDGGKGTVVLSVSRTF